MKHSVAHDLDRSLAKRAVEAAFTSYRERLAKYEPELSWSDEWTAVVSFRAAGMGLEGTVHVAPVAFDLALEVPLLFRLFEARAKAIVEREIATWIAKARAGELGT